MATGNLKLEYEGLYQEFDGLWRPGFLALDLQRQVPALDACCCQPLCQVTCKCSSQETRNFHKLWLISGTTTMGSLAYDRRASLNTSSVF